MSEYKCIVAKIDKIIQIPSADNIVVAKVLGDSVIVSKDHNEGDIGLLFIADTKISHDYLYNNNLYRNKELNLNKDKSGFFDENGRVRAQPFLKVRSEAYFAPLESLAYTGKVSLSLGDSFYEVNGKKICEKYVNPRTKNKAPQKAKTKVDATPYFNKHVDSEQYRYNTHKINVGDMIYFHAKRHGTSSRSSNTLVQRKPSTLKEKIMSFITGEKLISEWKVITGTRNVTLHNDQYKEGHHGSEQFRHDVTKTLEPYLDKGMTIYGEICGYANDKPIMSPHDVTRLKDKAYTKKYGKTIEYKYGCVKGTSRFHVYRISMTGMDGVERDFSDAQCRQWCEDRGIEYALEVHEPVRYDGDIDALNTLVEALTEREDVLCEDFIDPSHVSEGIILRVESGSKIPMFLKSKSYAFKVMEGIAKESTPDLEEES